MFFIDLLAEFFFFLTDKTAGPAASKPKGIGGVDLWFRMGRKLPDEFFVSLKGEAVSDTHWTVGNEFLTAEGRRVRVLTHDSVFSGYCSMVEYSNGAIRENTNDNHLFRIIE